MPPLSILDLAFVREGGRITKGRMKKAKLRRPVTGASGWRNIKEKEELKIKKAEHTATAVVISYVAAGHPQPVDNKKTAGQTYIVRCDFG